MSKKASPSMDQWLQEAKAHESAKDIGMYLTHNGVVRQTSRATAREGKVDAPVTGMIFGYDEALVEAVVADAYKMEGIHYVRVWLNEGELSVGDDIMYVLIGGDTRPHVVACLQETVGALKNRCVTEKEIQ